jgi:hypothetical protein
MRVEHATPSKRWDGHTGLQVPPDATIFPHLRTAHRSAGRKSHLEPSASRQNRLPISPGGRPSGRRPRPNLR